jgi:cysteine desulfuration protein SufE
MYPAPLQSLVDLFSRLPENERRELLIHYAGSSGRHAPQPGEVFDIEEVRKDAECTDTVGVHLRLSEAGRCHVRVTLGPEVQTLTRALSSVLCEGLEGTPAAEVLAVPDRFVEEIAGTELVRLRSRTVYYVFRRIKEALRKRLEDDVSDAPAREAQSAGDRSNE